MLSLDFEPHDDIQIYDTLRDASQDTATAVYTAEDKIAYTRAAKHISLSKASDGIEVGYAGASIMDTEVFARLREELSEDEWQKVHAFGTSIKHGLTPENDEMMQALLASQAPRKTIFIKSSEQQVESVLGTSLDEHLQDVSQSVQTIMGDPYTNGVTIDLEHFFDGFVTNPEFSKSCIKEVVAQGADTIVLCDTNGGMMPEYVNTILDTLLGDTEMQELFGSVKIGFHPHDDLGLALANTLAFITNSNLKKYCRAGVQIQGNLCKAGERIGNLDLAVFMSVIHTKGHELLSPEIFQTVRHTSNQASIILTGRELDPKTPMTGASAFTSVAGKHLAAQFRDPTSYDPFMSTREALGTPFRQVLGPQAGRGNILPFLSGLGYETPSKKQYQACYDMCVNNPEVRYENAWGSAALHLWEIMEEKNQDEVFLVTEFEGSVRWKDGKIQTSGWAKTNGESDADRATVRTGNKGILNDLCGSLLDRLRENKEFENLGLENFDLVKLREQSVGEHTDAYMRCTVIMRDSSSGAYWSCQDTGQTNDLAAFNAMIQAIKYGILIKQKKIQHLQDVTLVETYGSREETKLWQDQLLAA